MSEQTRAYVILVFMPLFFSSNLVIARAAVELVEPWTLSFWRWGAAVAILLPFARRGLQTYSMTLLAQWKTVALLGFLGMVVCGGFVYVSLRHTTATNATLIYTTSPVFVLVLEILFRGQRVTFRRAGGIALAFLGVVVIVMRGDVGRLLQLQFNPGDLGILLAAFAWATYSVILKRPSLQVFPNTALTAAVISAGILFLAPVMIWETTTIAVIPLTPPAWTSIVSLAVFSSLLPFLSYQYGVKILGPSVTSVFMYLMPAYGVLMAVLFLGETFRLYHAAGFVLIMAGVVMATAQFDRRTAPKVA